ncbi:patatin-like phospholipase family protein [Pollutimonas bauzanensis]|uniref:NTE family protein n=1 Tax=Pollutimonas bauzanensis TaxID=658167 RepID=A0A1M5Z2Z3_9BURK|nr:patatin-like phospholipase family protein [Pollutimonas bauzanensis]SHI18620.1 NTE family protein [Pollutimonas bauzanensis]
MFFSRQGRRTINLGLQGGGAHGAFTWGVLDYLLEDGRLEFEGVSGTSAGAMNAVILAHGLLDGGRDGARAALHKFWDAVAEALPFDMALQKADGQTVTLAPALKLWLHWTQYLAPHELNPFDLNPLRDILLEQVDFERLRAHSPVKLFIAAANANSGKVRVFRGPEIGVDAILASACLPTVQRTVQIDGEPYWDGGYVANPAVFPLFYECAANDILLVLLTPLKHQGTPRSAEEIKNRILELGFNATFLREMRMFAYMQKQAHASRLRIGYFERRMARANFHIIEAEATLRELKPETKLAASKWFFAMLRDLGRAQAQAWLQAHYADIGRNSTVDLAELFY